MSTRRDYFLEEPRAAALRKECQSWIGTPFRQRSAVKGPLGGVDCASYLASAFLAIGAINEAIAIPPYAINHAEHSDESMFRTWFEQPAVRARVRRLEDDEAPLVGDIIFPKVGRTEHHIAIRDGNQVYHVARPSGVCCMTIAQFKFGFHRSRYRLTES